MTEEEALKQAKEALDKMDKESKEKFKRQYETELAKKRKLTLADLFPR